MNLSQATRLSIEGVAAVRAVLNGSVVWSTPAPAEPVALAYDDAVLADAPAIYLPLAEDAVDVSASGINGTVAGGAVFTDGRLRLATAGQWVDLPNDARLRPTAGLTVEAWVQADVIASTQAIWGASDWPEFENFTLQATDRARIELDTTTGSGGQSQSNSNNGTVTPGVEHHLVGTYDGTAMRIYCDGALIAGPTGKTGTLKWNINGQRLGARLGASEQLIGWMRRFALYDHALTPTQVATHYAAGLPDAGPAPTVPAAGTTLLSAGTGNTTTDLDSFKTASGQTTIPTWMTFVPDNSTFTKAISDIAVVGSPRMELAWSFPDTTQAAIAAGNSDTYIAQRAAQLRKHGGPVYLRLNWEMNGDWYAYSAFNPDGSARAGNSPAEYVAAWRRVVDIVRPLAPNAVFVWCPHLWTYHGTPPDQWYPGDDYVDWVAVTAYPGSADWSWVQDGEWGLQDFADFAIAHGKPMRICEWGVGQGDSATNVGIFYQFRDWLVANPVVREIVYFHMTGLNSIDYRLNLYPDWSYAYRTEFTANPDRWSQAG